MTTTKLVIAFSSLIVILLFVWLGVARSEEVCSVTRTDIENFLKANAPMSNVVELTAEQEKHLAAAYAFHGRPLDPTVTHILASDKLKEGSMFLFLFNDAGCLITKGPLSTPLFNRAIAGEEEGPVANN